VPDPVRRQRLYFCYGDVGLLISEDEGQTFWRSFAGMKSSLNCFKIVVDAQSPSTVWGTTGLWAANVGYVCRSDDGAKTWKPVGRPETGLPVGQTRQIAMDMTSPVGRRRLLVTSDANGVYETRDGGETWRCLTASLPAKAAKSPRGLILDPADPQHVILALAGAPADGGGVWETPDGGATWRRLNQDQALFWDITCLAADPRDLATLYAGARQHYDKALRRPYPGGLFKSGDGGKTWKMILDAFYVSDVAISPTSSQVIYVATMDQPYHDNPLGEGVLKSVDGGATWRRENTGLSHRNIRSVTISPHDPSALYAGSIGNSAFIGKDRSAAK
jgi:photosystem II stability/assembly factor-like uncharacterized protein